MRTTILGWPSQAVQATAGANFRTARCCRLLAGHRSHPRLVRGGWPCQPTLRWHLPSRRRGSSTAQLSSIQATCLGGPTPPAQPSMESSPSIVSNVRHSSSVLSGSRQPAQEPLPIASPRARQNSDLALNLLQGTTPRSFGSSPTVARARARPCLSSRRGR